MKVCGGGEGGRCTRARDCVLYVMCTCVYVCARVFWVCVCVHIVYVCVCLRESERAKEVECAREIMQDRVREREYVRMNIYTQI